ncbi:MAG: ATP-binding cassette domain-containing protein, partial [Clostridia bacterium]|nr:ATP-binding cassette domain-containing protein [Clostridia bacterium]
LYLPLEITGTKTKDNVKYVDELLEKYKLKEFEKYYPHQLSGGMRQRAALIRTLATKPDLLLLDEPFSALDYQTRLAVCDDVYSIIRQEKKTALLVTHDITEAISLSDKIIVLTERPSKVKKIFKTDFDKNVTPLKRRESQKFSEWFEKLYKELNA